MIKQYPQMQKYINKHTQTRVIIKDRPALPHKTMQGRLYNEQGQSALIALEVAVQSDMHKKYTLFNYIYNHLMQQTPVDKEHIILDAIQRVYQLNTGIAIGTLPFAELSKLITNYDYLLQTINPIIQVEQPQQTQQSQQQTQSIIKKRFKKKGEFLAYQ